MSLCKPRTTVHLSFCMMYVVVAATHVCGFCFEVRGLNGHTIRAGGLEGPGLIFYRPSVYSLTRKTVYIFSTV